MEDFSSQLHRGVRRAKNGVHSDASSKGHSLSVLNLVCVVAGAAGTAASAAAHYCCTLCAGGKLRERGNGSCEIQTQQGRG